MKIICTKKEQDNLIHTLKVAFVASSMNVLDGIDIDATEIKVDDIPIEDIIIAKHEWEITDED